MPDEPFILKANHDAGSFLIVRDKNTIDWKKVQVDAKRWLLRKYFYLDREWQYKNIKPSLTFYYINRHLLSSLFKTNRPNRSNF